MSKLFPHMMAKKKHDSQKKHNGQEKNMMAKKKHDGQEKTVVVIFMYTTFFKTARPSQSVGDLVVK